MDDEKLKLAVISGASHALDYMRNNKKATPDDAIEHVSNEMDQILEKLHSEE